MILSTVIMHTHYKVNASSSWIKLVYYIVAYCSERATCQCMKRTHLENGRIENYWELLIQILFSWNDA